MSVEGLRGEQMSWLSAKLAGLIGGEITDINVKGVQAGATYTLASAQAALNIQLFAAIAIIAALVAAGIWLYQMWKDNENAVHELAAEKAKLASEEQQQFISLKAQVDRYEELNDTLNRTQEQESERLELIKQISSAYPDLVAGIDAEGNAILKTNEALERKLALQQKEALVAEVESFHTTNASMSSAKWNAGLDKGAPGQGTVDASKKLQTIIDEAATEMDVVSGDYSGTAAATSIGEYLLGNLDISPDLLKENLLKSFQSVKVMKLLLFLKRS